MFCVGFAVKADDVLVVNPRPDELKVLERIPNLPWNVQALLDFCVQFVCSESTTQADRPNR